VGPREYQLGAELGRFVELMRETHNTQGPGQIAVIVNAKIVVDASDESGNEVGVCVVVDRLKERGATHLVIMEIALFGKETIVHLLLLNHFSSNFVFVITYHAARQIIERPCHLLSHVVHNSKLTTLPQSKRR
jgi:hypothetical protein